MIALILLQRLEVKHQHLLFAWIVIGIYPEKNVSRSRRIISRITQHFYNNTSIISLAKVLRYVESEHMPDVNSCGYLIVFTLSAQLDHHSDSMAL